MVQLTERASSILKAVIKEYMRTGRPVGSKTIVNRYGIKLSSASVRNEMAKLTEMGFLSQPHISSGRKPTELSLRYYLDNMLTIEELPEKKKEIVQSMYANKSYDLRAVVMVSSKVLATLTNFAGVAWSPGIESFPLQHIEFIKLKENRIMAVMMSHANWVQTSVFDWNEYISHEELSRAADYLNEQFEGKTLLQVRDEIKEQMKNEKAEFDRLMAKTLKLMESALVPAEGHDQLFIHGGANLVENPEFADVEKMKAIFRAFEEKCFIVKLLSKTLTGEDYRVFLSSEENAPNLLPGLALIVAGFGDNKDLHGAMGVIGPVRMDYPSIIPLVKYTAQYASSLLTT